MKGLLKPFILRWLDERALRLPASRRKELAAKLRVSEQVIEAIETEFREHVLKQVKEW